MAKLQEEVNENREKISTLQTRLTTAQKGTQFKMKYAAFNLSSVEKDSISSQLQIVEDIKQHLSQQLEAKNKQLEEYQTDTNNLTSKLTETQQTLGIALEQVAKSKNETLDHSLKRARTEVVSELRSICTYIFQFFFFSLMQCNYQSRTRKRGPNESNQGYARGKRQSYC